MTGGPSGEFISNHPLFGNIEPRFLLMKRCFSNVELETRVDLPLMISHEELVRMAQSKAILHLATKNEGYFSFENSSGFVGLIRTDNFETHNSQIHEDRRLLVRRKSFRLYYDENLILIWSCLGFKKNSCKVAHGLVLGTVSDPLDKTDNQFSFGDPLDSSIDEGTNTKHEMLVHLGIDESLISEYALWREEQRFGIKFMKHEFVSHGTNSQTVLLRVQRSETSTPKVCPFIISEGSFRTVSDDQLVLVEGLADRFLDVVFGRNVTKFFGSFLKFHNGIATITSIPDGVNERRLDLGLVPFDVDTGIYVSDKVLFCHPLVEE